MEATAHRPLSSRINLRLMLVAAVFFGLVGYPVYLYVDAKMNGGIKKVGNLDEVDLKALGNFPFNETNGSLAEVPPQFRALDGKQVVLEGFPYPTNYAGDQVPQFQFVYNITKCCFGGPPKVQERVFAHAPKGTTVPFYDSQFSRLQGVLHVRPVKMEGKVISLYDMTIEKVEPLQ